MNTDLKLLKLVHHEQIGEYLITATITRFGGFCVIARHNWDNSIYQDILEAREWVRKQKKIAA